ncbi:uncharacterized protein TNIN_378831, partial [Trichonephila inaurata madagascariensis]
IGRAPLGTEVIGRAPLGTEVIGRAPLGTEVIGRAPLGTQVIGRAPLGTQVIPPSGEETHPDISFHSAVSDSLSSTNRERISPEFIIDDTPLIDLNRTVRLDDVLLPGDPLPQVPLPQVPLPQTPLSQKIVTPSRIPVIIPGSIGSAGPIVRLFRRMEKQLGSKLPTPVTPVTPQPYYFPPSYFP